MTVSRLYIRSRRTIEGVWWLIDMSEAQSIALREAYRRAAVKPSEGWNHHLGDTYLREAAKIPIYSVEIEIYRKKGFLRRAALFEITIDVDASNGKLAGVRSAGWVGDLDRLEEL